MSLLRITLILAAAAAIVACGADSGGGVDTSFVQPPNDADLDSDDTGDARDDADARDGAGDAPDVGGIPRVDVRIRDADLAAMHRSPESRAEYPARIVVDGVSYDDGEIEVHGGFARTVPKLSYRLKFDDDDPLVTRLFSEEPEAHRRVVLQASWIDPTYARNCLTLDLVRELGGLAPRCAYVELEFNGVYQGLYVAIERVDEVYLERNGLTPDGLVLKASSHQANWAAKANPLAGFEIQVNDDAPTGPLGELLAVLDQTPTDAASYAAEVEPWLDLDDFTTWQLAHTLADNRDTFTKNYYLHYDWVGASTPFRIVTWDADATWGINWDGATVDPAVQSRSWGNDAFSPRLFSIDAYRTPYLARYAALVQGGELRAWVAANLDAREERIHAAAERDLQAWGRDFVFDDEVEYLRAAVDARFDVMGQATAP